MESDANVFQAFIGWVKFCLHFHTHFSLKSRGGDKGEGAESFPIFLPQVLPLRPLLLPPGGNLRQPRRRRRRQPREPPSPPFPLTCLSRETAAPTFAKLFRKRLFKLSHLFFPFFFKKNPEQHSSLFELASCPLGFSSPFQRTLRGVRCDVWVSERSSGLSGYETTEIFFSRPEWTLVVEEVNSVILYKQA